MELRRVKGLKKATAAEHTTMLLVYEAPVYKSDIVIFKVSRQKISSKGYAMSIEAICV